jgi:hypothetical protein
MRSKEEKQLKFVIDAGLLLGFDENDDRFIKTKEGYIGGIRIPGIDIFHFKELDQQISMSAYGNAIRTADCPTKQIFFGCAPDYSSQIMNIARKEKTQKNEFHKKILARQRAWYELYQEKQEERLAHVLFFGEEPSLILKQMDKYVTALTGAKMTVHVNRGDDFVPVFKILLQGGSD